MSEDYMRLDAGSGHTADYWVQVALDEQRDRARDDHVDDTSDVDAA